MALWLLSGAPLDLVASPLFVPLHRPSLAGDRPLLVSLGLPVGMSAPCAGAPKGLPRTVYRHQVAESGSDVFRFDTVVSFLEGIS